LGSSVPLPSGARSARRAAPSGGLGERVRPHDRAL